MKLSIKIPLLTILFAFLATLLTFSLLARQHYLTVQKLLIEEIDIVIGDYQYLLDQMEKKVHERERMQSVINLSFNKVMSQFSTMPGLVYSLVRDDSFKIHGFKLNRDKENYQYRNKKGQEEYLDYLGYERKYDKFVWKADVSAILFDKSGMIIPEQRSVWNVGKAISRMISLYNGEVKKRIPVIQVTRPVYLTKDRNSSRYFVDVGVSVSHIWTYINHDLKAVAIPLLILFLVLIFLAILLSLDVIISINKMSRGAQELAAENYEYRIELKRKDELGNWAELFNKMAIKLTAIIKELQDKLEERNKLFKLATEDGLTKAFVHRYLMDLLENEIKRSKRSENLLSFIMCDIDHFKKFNDTYGHQTGDYVLAKVSQIYMENVRNNIDIVGRYGGEEFGVVLPDTDKKGAVAAAEKIRKAIEATKYSYKGNTFSVTISLGVSTMKAGSVTKENIVKWADKALYHSKENGRNKTSFYTEDKSV